MQNAGYVTVFQDDSKCMWWYVCVVDLTLKQMIDVCIRVMCMYSYCVYMCIVSVYNIYT